MGGHLPANPRRGPGYCHEVTFRVEYANTAGDEAATLSVSLRTRQPEAVAIALQVIEQEYGFPHNVLGDFLLETVPHMQHLWDAACHADREEKRRIAELPRTYD